MRILLIVNTAASSVTARTRVVIQKALSADHQVTMAETSRRGHATRLAQGAAADKVDVVVALGGDGTLNEAANGLARTATALGVLPGGSTNVYARSIGLVNDPIEATGQLLASLSAGAIRPVSLGVVNGRYFLFHVGFGFDAAVVAEVEKRSVWKRYLGAAVFLVAALSTWSTGYERHKPWFEVHAPGIDIDEAAFAICLKTSPYTFLGERSLDVAPGTGFDTGLSLLTFRRLTLPALLPVLTAALRSDGSSDGSARSSGSGRSGGSSSAAGSGGSSFLGRLAGRAGHNRARLDRGLDAIEVIGRRPVPYQVDGDYLGEAEAFHIRCEPAALRLVVPLPVTT